MDSGRQDVAPEWYLREEQGTIYGPYPLEHIQEWIRDNRIPEGYLVSVDRDVWVKAEDALAPG